MTVNTTLFTCLSFTSMTPIRSSYVSFFESCLILFVWTCIHTHACMHTPTHTHTHAHMHAHTHAHTHTRTHTHTHTHTHTAELGDYDPQKHPPNYVSEFRLFPVAIQTEELEEKIAELHQSLRGRSTKEIEFQFLSYARR